MNEVTFTSPVGRLVGGDLYTGQTKDDKGQPLVFKSGANAGQPRTEYYQYIAIPKAGEASWRDTEWGRIIVAKATEDWPQGQTQRADFAWKVIDGDSSVPESSNRAPNSREGYPGNWVIRTSGGFTPTVMNRDGSEQLTQANLVNLGDYIQAFVGVEGNKSQQSPGIYLNYKAFAFVGHGERIVLSSGPDLTNAKFGQAPIPAGVMAQPAAGNFATQQAAAAPNNAPAPAAPAPAAVAPVPAILQPPVPQEPQLTPKAAGVTYAQMIAAGWTDETLKQHGYLA